LSLSLSPSTFFSFSSSSVMSHVRFGEVMDRTEIKVETTGENQIFANLGFLQDQHVYLIHVSLPLSTSSMSKREVTANGDLPVQTATVEKKDDHSELSLEIRLEGVHGQVQSRLSLDALSPPIDIVLRASVLKSHDGTPSLKHGISIVSRLDNDDSSSVASGAPVTCN
ncbi:hypothetical protein PFISCL1PPCAC_27053, partial [Pristionchus fissidentatus]